MNRICTLLLAILSVGSINAQGIFCNPNGNVVIFTNYDGGTLNINVDVNTPNIKIGVVSYEAVTITISGAFASNVTEVRYAGYNSGGTTSITGAGAAATSITFAPPSPLPNASGYPSIICGYSCSTNSSQGGCNTVDQIESYFNSVFSTTSLYMHRVQYGIWSGTQNMSAGGDCCALAVPLSVQVSAIDEACEGACDGALSAVASGGQSPYSYAWSTGASTDSIGGLCPATYSVTVTDNNGATLVETGTIAAASAIVSNQNLTLCGGESVSVGSNTYTSTGNYTDTLISSAGCDSVVNTDLMVYPVYETEMAFSFNACEEISVTIGTSTYTTAGIHYDTLSSVQGCDSVIETMINVTPAMLITQQPNNVNLPAGNNAVFSLSASASANLQWQENNGTGFINLSNVGQYAGVDAPSLTISNTAQQMNNYLYRCIATESNCSDTSTAAVLTVREPLGIETTENTSTWLIYPNPVSNVLLVQNALSQNAKFSLIDQTGKLVMTGRLMSTSNHIDVSALTDGVYFLKIEGETRSTHSVKISH